MSNARQGRRLGVVSDIQKFKFSTDLNDGYVIEKNSGHFLTTTFNYTITNNIEPCHVHDTGVVRRLLAGEIKIQTPKKLYPATLYRGRVEITGKAFSWKGLSLS